jgi:hypothetical protein
MFCYGAYKYKERVNLFQNFFLGFGLGVDPIYASGEVRVFVKQKGS